MTALAPARPFATVCALLVPLALRDLRLLLVLAPEDGLGISHLIQNLRRVFRAFPRVVQRIWVSGCRPISAVPRNPPPLLYMPP
jgi:hypothetical protein